MPRALIVDDDKNSLAGVAEWVRENGFEIDSAETVAAAHALIEKQRFDLAMLDLQLPDGTGTDIIGVLREQPDVEIVIVTGHGTIDSAVEALKLGASDYLTKPINLDRLEKILEKIRRTWDLREKVEELRGELRRLGRFGCMIGASEPMQHVYDLIGRVAGTGSTVFITGETGTGKELAAQMVHELSRRSPKPFVPVNCGAMPSSLIESELFGHEKGSFTGADRQHAGVLERANHGTLFLDEVTEMPLESQVRLLRVLETGTFHFLTLGIPFVCLGIVFSGPTVAADATGPRGRDWGVRFGVADGPDQIVGGVHFNAGRLAEHVWIQPSVELGIGDDFKTLYGTGPFLYRFRVKGGPVPYAGGGPSAGLVDRDRPNDESDLEIGARAIGGVEWQRPGGHRLFLELNLGFGDTHDAQILVGWSF